MKNDQVESNRQARLSFLESIQEHHAWIDEQLAAHPYAVKTTWDVGDELYRTNGLAGIECFEPDVPYLPFRGGEDRPVYIYFKHRDDAILFKLIHG